MSRRITNLEASVLAMSGLDIQPQRPPEKVASPPVPFLPATAEALRYKTWPRSGVSEGVEKIWSSSSNPESGPDLG